MGSIVPFGLYMRSGSLYFPRPEDPVGAPRPMQNILRRALPALAVLALPLAARADEAKLVLPDLASVQFLGMSGRSLLLVVLVRSPLAPLFRYPTLLDPGQ